MHLGLLGLAFTVGDDESVILTLTSALNEWRWLSCDSTSWLVDGKQYTSIGDVIHHSKEVRAGHGVMEILFFKITPKILDDLAAAKKIEFKICTDEFEVKKRDMQDLHAFAEAVKKAGAK